MFSLDYLMLYATLLCGIVLFGNVLLNPGTNHKPVISQDKTGAFVLKTTNWGMMKNE